MILVGTKRTQFVDYFESTDRLHVDDSCCDILCIKHACHTSHHSHFHTSHTMHRSVFGDRESRRAQERGTGLSLLLHGARTPGMRKNVFDEVMPEKNERVCMQCKVYVS